MKISYLQIRGFQQFEDFFVDLRDPANGQALSEVCFIGPNGTGKSTLLRLIASALTRMDPNPLRLSKEGWPLRAIGLQTSVGDWTLIGRPSSPATPLREAAMRSDQWRFLSNAEVAEGLARQVALQQTAEFRLKPGEELELLPHAEVPDVVAHVLPDSAPVAPGLPATTLNQALALFKDFPVLHQITEQHASQFWDVLIYLLKKRENDWQLYLQQPDNRSRTVEEVTQSFESSHPEILKALAETWDRILAPVGLEFDYAKAKVPVQLNENLEAFVRLKQSQQPLDYHDLSSGIRNLLFRLGHVQALYFGRSVRYGFLLLDEPENSLYPDLLYDLMDLYRKVVVNTQIIVATHSPIIAAQFRRESRVVLEFDDAGHVRARPGVTPEGDDPNDILTKDFAVRSIYGKEGQKKWERFLELQRIIPACPDPEERKGLEDELMKIGADYNFDPCRP